MGEGAKAVFLSYASQDAQEVSRVRDALQTAGVEVWFDQAELHGGDAWDAAIRKRIKDCALFVPVVSTNTNDRDEGYFRLEWKLAVDRSHLMASDKPFLLPITLDGTPQESARVPERFLDVQWSRLSGHEAMASFADRVRRLLSGGAPVSPLPVPGADRVAAGSDSEGPSIAVLPFVNLSADEENEYFADGLAEELLNVLANIRGLRVASRTSAFFFKGKDVDVPTIARKLNVATVLEGSVRKAGKRIRVAAQLIEVASDSHLWSRTYDRELDDIFALQDDIAQSVVTELRRALMGETDGSAQARAEVAAAAAGRGDDAQAYQLYLQARFYSERTTEVDAARAIDLFRKALALDPNFALAWSGLSTAYFVQGAYGWQPPAQRFEDAREAAQRAVTLAPDLAEGHVCLARVMMSADWNWDGASRALQKAFELAPGNMFVLRARGQHASILGRREEAIRIGRDVVARDPLSFAGHFQLGMRLAREGRLEEAEAEVRTACDIDPGGGVRRFGLALIRLLRGHADEALELSRQEVLPSLRLLGAVLAHHTLGQPEQSETAIQELIARHTANSCYEIASAFAWRGEKDRAFEWLERAFAQRDPGLVHMLGDSLFAKLRDDGRWRVLVEKVGLPLP